MANYVKIHLEAEVAEWQTRRSQKPVGIIPHVGSTPTLGTYLLSTYYSEPINLFLTNVPAIYILVYYSAG